MAALTNEEQALVQAAFAKGSRSNNLDTDARAAAMQRVMRRRSSRIAIREVSDDELDRMILMLAPTYQHYRGDSREVQAALTKSAYRNWKRGSGRIPLNPNCERSSRKLGILCRPRIGWRYPTCGASRRHGPGSRVDG